MTFEFCGLEEHHFVQNYNAVETGLAEEEKDNLVVH